MPDLFGRIIVVTGGSSGIGAELVKQLAKKNATVINASRNMPAAHK